MWFNITREDIQNYVLVRDNKLLAINLSNDNKLIDVTVLVVGFLDLEPSNSLKTINIKDLKREGQYYVRAFEKDVKNDEVTKPGFNILTGFYCDGKTMNDGANQPSEYKRISYLPYNLVSQLEAKSRADNKDYIKEYRAETLKAKVTADKTYFYDGPSEAQKRKAFLIKDDVAFVNTVTKNWIEVEYHSNTITRGWIKASDLEIGN